MAYDFLQKGVDGNDEQAVSERVAQLTMSIEYRDGVQCVILDDRDVTAFLRTEEVGRMASLTSRYPAVRAKLLSIQQNLAKTTDLIMDGRDIGTVVLPHADVKIFLTASSAVRAKRRYDELTARGEDCDLAEIEADIIARDEQDMNRAVAPLKKAEDAWLLDTSALDIDGVIAEMKKIIGEVI